MNLVSWLSRCERERKVESKGAEEVTCAEFGVKSDRLSHTPSLQKKSELSSVQDLVDEW